MIALHALTLHRPWQWPMSHKPEPGARWAYKPIENRSWPPPDWLLGRYLALHAGKHWDDDGLAHIRRAAHDAPGLRAMPGSAADHPQMAIVSVVRVLGYLERGKGVTAAPGFEPDEISDGIDLDTWWFGQFGWIVDEATLLARPVPCRGFQKLWTVREDIAAIVRDGWKAARAA